MTKSFEKIIFMRFIKNHKIEKLLAEAFKAMYIQHTIHDMYMSGLVGLLRIVSVKKDRDSR